MTNPSVVSPRTRRWQSYIWDALDKSPEERRFVLKLDVFLTGFACLGWFPALLWYLEDDLTRIEGFFLKSLDQFNISNAFVSGMYASPFQSTRKASAYQD